MKVFLDRNAAKFVQKLVGEDRERILRRLKDLETDPFLGNKLKGRKGTYSLRIGEFRVIYEIHAEIQEVWVLKIDKRGRVYKRL